MAVQAQGKIPMYLVFMLACALVVLGSVLWKEETFAATVELVEHEKHAIVNMHYDEEFKNDLQEMLDRHKNSDHKQDISEEDLEDDQYIGELEDDDDGSYAEDWMDSIDNEELYPDDDEDFYPSSDMYEREATRDPKFVAAHGVHDDDEWLGEDPEDEIDPDYTDFDLFDPEWDDHLDLGPGGEELAEKKIEEEEGADVPSTSEESESGGTDEAEPPASEEEAAPAEGSEEKESGADEAGDTPEKKRKSRRMLNA